MVKYDFYGLMLRPESLVKITTDKKDDVLAIIDDPLARDVSTDSITIGGHTLNVAVNPGILSDKVVLANQDKLWLELGSSKKLPPPDPDAPTAEDERAGSW